MISIDGILLNTTVSDILEELRFELATSNNSYIMRLKDSGDNIMINCPFHKGGTERKPSFGISKRNGLSHCFSCGYSANLSTFISNVFGYNDFGVFGSRWLRKNFAEISVEERPDIDIDVNRKELKHNLNTYIPEMVLDRYRWIHPYMYQRRLTDEIIERYDVGYDKETDCITFPVRDRQGNTTAIVRRSVSTKYFHNSFGKEKSLYGLYELPKDAEDVFVCESIINCLTVVSLGYNAVALLGTGSRSQIEELKRLRCRSIIVALDPDDAGKGGTQKIINAVRPYKLVYTLPYKDGRDLNDLPDDEIHELYKNRQFAQ